MTTTASEPVWYTLTPQDAVLRDVEWLLVDGFGGFAMGNAAGMPDRRYHGLLIAASTPPVGRIMALNGVVDEVVIAAPGQPARTIALCTFQFRDGTLAPDGATRLIRFEKGLGHCAWTYRLDDALTITRTLRLGWRSGGAELTWSLDGELPKSASVTLRLRPLLRLADMHKLSTDESRVFQLDLDEDVFTLRAKGEAHLLHLHCPNASFTPDPDWWRDFHYRQETDRGQEDRESLYCPGAFVRPMQLNRPARLRAWLNDAVPPATITSEPRSRHLTLCREALAATNPALACRQDLLAAADDFVVPRRVGEQSLMTIIAGYPWFTDWGRDTMIALPGLLLTTHRFDEALDVLRAFASHCRNGLIPNLFDDQQGAAHYNTVDASLWFCHAACEYRRTSGNTAAFTEHLRDACLEILVRYRDGTDFGIRMDPLDALIIAGDDATQLTWMDAARDGVVFTPRGGKPVEINALWHHALRSVAVALMDDEPDVASSLNALAARAGRSLNRLFWNPDDGCLADLLTPRPAAVAHRPPQWTQDRAIRPNMLFAVSLRHSPLPTDRRLAVVEVARRKLLTPVGLRTLDPAHPAYRPRFEGDMTSRDSAYHQGTVWPWLMGPYVEALLRANDFSDEVRAEAKSLLEGLRRQMLPPRAPTLGQIVEVYDADDTPDRPRRHGGTAAQAWSVSELLRCLALLDAPPEAR